MRILKVRPFQVCLKCGKKGYRATNTRDGIPIMRCRYCGFKVAR